MQSKRVQYYTIQSSQPNTLCRNIHRNIFNNTVYDLISPTRPRLKPTRAITRYKNFHNRISDHSNLFVGDLLSTYLRHPEKHFHRLR